jgi:hypothetical protein
VDAVGEGHVLARVVAAQVDAVGVGEDFRIAVGDAHGDDHALSGADGDTGDCQVLEGDATQSEMDDGQVAQEFFHRVGRLLRADEQLGYPGGWRTVGRNV